MGVYDAKQAKQIADFIDANKPVKLPDLMAWAVSQGIFNHTGRISDARKLGYVIDCKKVGRQSEYTVTARPGEVQLGF